ncbi:MAG: aldo/keto reductase [Clostridiales bacterium]|nr:aldo/keto reductase [Clostridiales bacterium]
MENNGFKNEIMIGTWSWGEGANGSKAVFGQKFTKEHLNEVFDKAYDAGFTAWDTAEVYGMGASERLVGSFISGKDVFISTKHFPNRKYKEGENRKALEASLERLGLSKVDLYWLHSPKEIEKNMKELSQLQKEGLIEHIGLSNGNVEQIKLAEKVLEENGCKLYAIQNHYSLLAMDREKDVLSYCKEKGILFFGYMLLEQGALSGHYDKDKHFSIFTFRGILFPKYKFKKINALIEYIRELGQTHNIDPSQIAVIWGRSKGIIPIVGINKPHHVKPLKDGLSVELSDEEILKLEELTRASGVMQKASWE